MSAAKAAADGVGELPCSSSKALVANRVDIKAPVASKVGVECHVFEEESYAVDVVLPADQDRRNHQQEEGDSNGEPDATS